VARLKGWSDDDAKDFCDTLAESESWAKKL